MGSWWVLFEYLVVVWWLMVLVVAVVCVTVLAFGGF